MNMQAAPAIAERSGGVLPRASEPSVLPELIESFRASLRRRWFLLLFVVALVAGATVFILINATPTYIASAQLKIDPSKSAAVGELSDVSGIPDQLIVDTETNQMRSLEVARAVVASQRLLSEPAFSLLAGADAKLSLTRSERAERLAGLLLANVEAVRVPSTYLVELRYRSTDPELAALIANSFASEYIMHGFRQRAGRAAAQSRVLQERLGELGAEAAAAEQRLADYKATMGIMTATDGRDSTLAEQQLAALALQQAAARSESAAAKARLDAAEAQMRAGGITSVSAVLSSGVVADLRSQRAALIKSRDDISVRYGPLHPQTQIADRQLTSLDRQIREESERIIAGLRSDAASAAARATSLNGGVAALEAQRTRETRGSAYSEMYQREVESAQSAYDRLAERAELSQNAARSAILPAQIVARATVPDAPASPNRPAIVASGLLISLLLGGLSVAVAEAASTRFLSLRDVRRLGLQLLGCIPKLSRPQITRQVGAEGTPADLLPSCPFSAYTESLRTTAAALVTQRREKVFAIASSLPGEGKSTISLSLARSLALSGWRVIAIDGDLRRGGLTRMAGIRCTLGLAELLRGKADLAEALVTDAASPLDILPIAKTFAEVEAPFADQVMALLLTQLRLSYDAIVIDTPPIIGLADGRLLAGMADATALVIRWNATPEKAVLQTLEVLAAHEANLAGTILSMVGKASDAYGGEHFSRKYRHYYRAL